MADSTVPEPFELEHGGVTIVGETLGEGPDVVLTHGLTATRRYTVMGSKALPRAGYRLTTFDARGHGDSSPAPSSDAYEYRDLVEDMRAVLEHLGIEQAAIGGASMGAHTAMAFALAWPERVSALVAITPAYDGRQREDARDLAAWDRLADGLEGGGVDGFLDAWNPHVEERFLETVLTVTRQRLERHKHPAAVADALRVVPRSLVFEGLEELENVEIPTLVVASRDEADPSHPFAIAEAWAERLPNGKLVTEDEGKSPLAWQGARLSKAIAEFLGEQGYS